MINTIIYIVLSLVIFALLYVVLISRHNIKKLLSHYVQSEMDKHAIMQKLNEVSEELNRMELEKSDGFVRFLSESRDWAFKYIEEVQTALAEFDKDVTPELQWFNKFGLILGETAHTDVLKRISEAYDKLKLVLPENTETPNN